MQLDQDTGLEQSLISVFWYYYKFIFCIILMVVVAFITKGFLTVRIFSSAERGIRRLENATRGMHEELYSVRSSCLCQHV